MAVMWPDLWKGDVYIHASNSLNLKICNSACVWSTALQFGSRTFLLLHIYNRNFGLLACLQMKYVSLKCQIQRHV